MELPIITEKHLLESKNTSDQFSRGRSNQKRGLWAEDIAYKYFIEKKYNFISRRKKLKFGEVDLIFSFKNEIFFIEVKALHNDWMTFQRLNVNQKNRILKNSIYYQLSNPKYTVSVLLCFVSQDRSINIINLND